MPEPNPPVVGGLEAAAGDPKLKPAEAGLGAVAAAPKPVKPVLGAAVVVVVGAVEVAADPNPEKVVLGASFFSAPPKLKLPSLLAVSVLVSVSFLTSKEGLVSAGLAVPNPPKLEVGALVSSAGAPKPKPPSLLVVSATALFSSFSLFSSALIAVPKAPKAGFVSAGLPKLVAPKVGFVSAG